MARDRDRSTLLETHELFMTRVYKERYRNIGASITLDIQALWTPLNLANHALDFAIGAICK